MTTAERLYQIIADTLGTDAEKISRGDHLAEDLGVDSLDRVELLLAVEDEFGVSITEEQANAWLIVGDVEDALTEAGA